MRHSQASPSHCRGSNSIGLFLDSEFSQPCAQAKPIFLALVGKDRRGFYVELQDAWKVDGCSDFVKKIVLPQPWGGEHAMFLTEARAALLRFQATYDEQLEIVTDAPAYDWELFCELAYHDGKWPKNVRNFPTDATTLTATSDREELPHHALLDARIIAGMFTARV